MKSCAFYFATGTDGEPVAACAEHDKHLGPVAWQDEYQCGLGCEADGILVAKVRRPWAELLHARDLAQRERDANAVRYGELLEQFRALEERLERRENPDDADDERREYVVDTLDAVIRLVKNELGV